MAGSLNYKPFTFKAALELVSPPTWVASVGPCLVAGALALCCALQFTAASSGAETSVLANMAVQLDLRSALCWFLMLSCGVLMQSATNTLNDYQDFISGLDTAETILDETDASIVYNQINPQNAKVLAVLLLAVAGICGVAVVILTDLSLLILGVISALVVVLYSAGPKPISSLPIGELVSGVVMGGILLCATFYATTLTFSSVVLAVSLAPVVAIGQIMQTNNTCDIERDLLVGRKTMPGIIGLQRSRMLNGALSIGTFIWLAVVMVWAGLYWSLLVVLLGCIVCLPKANRLLKGPYDLQNRRVMMQTVVSYNKWLQATAALAFLLGGTLSVFI